MMSKDFGGGAGGSSPGGAGSSTAGGSSGGSFTGGCVVPGGSSSGDFRVAGSFIGGFGFSVGGRSTHGNEANRVPPQEMRHCRASSSVRAFSRTRSRKLSFQSGSRIIAARSRMRTRAVAIASHAPS